MTELRTKKLIDYFWPQGDLLHTPQVYAILDGARDHRIEPAVRFSKLEYLCLYSGTLSPRLEAAAPYIVHLSPDSPLTKNLLEQHWLDAWGIFVIAPPELAMNQLRRHFRKFLRVEDESGKRMAFRFYDPRVLRIYLPTCNHTESEFIFGDIERFVTSGLQSNTLLEFDLAHAGLRTKTVPLDEPEIVIKAKLGTNATSAQSSNTP